MADGIAGTGCGEIGCGLRSLELLIRARRAGSQQGWMLGNSLAMALTVPSAWMTTESQLSTATRKSATAASSWRACISSSWRSLRAERRPSSNSTPSAGFRPTLTTTCTENQPLADRRYAYQAAAVPVLSALQLRVISLTRCMRFVCSSAGSRPYYGNRKTAPSRRACRN